MFIGMLAALLLAGCQSANVKPQPNDLGADPLFLHTGTIIWMDKEDACFLAGLPSWQRQIWTDVPGDPLILVCHGAQISSGPWMLYPEPSLHMAPMTVDSVVETLRAVFPARPIVLLVCNPRNQKMSIGNVWYGKGLVWSPPMKPDEAIRQHDGVHCIEQMTHSK